MLRRRQVLVVQDTLEVLVAQLIRQAEAEVLHT